MLLNCGVGKDSWVSWTARRSNQSILKEISSEYSLDIHFSWWWSWNSSTLATWCEELTHWKRPWCWERLKAGGEGENRGWDGWMASPSHWTWVWVDSGSWWWTGRSMGSQRVGHDWATEQNWTEPFAPFTPQRTYLPPGVHRKLHLGIRATLNPFSMYLGDNCWKRKLPNWALSGSGSSVFLNLSVPDSAAARFWLSQVTSWYVSTERRADSASESDREGQLQHW